ncbi:unnamed protein product [Orchesella dallaii]|uniref:Odorant receptor n=1 Tax=Orchesella dallaii TaxID=48710 RepID=A0ABP1QB41_9HEXA
MRKPNRISVSSYTESFYNFFASTGINHNSLSRDKNGEFQISYIRGWRLIIFILLRLNVYSKIIYLLLLFNGYIPVDEELDFFTRFGIVIWLATTSVAVYSDYYYLRKYPCFVTLCTFWNIQSEIFQLLSIEKREEFRKRLDSGARFRTTFHMTMSSIAMFGLGVQYVMDPKGILFTGYLVNDDRFVLTFLFGFLEEFFLYATWAQAVSMILINVLAYRELTVVFEVLADEVNSLSDRKEQFLDLRGRLIKYPSKSKALGKNANTNFQPLSYRMEGDPDSSFDQSRYTIDLIFLEYRKLQIITDQMRSVMSYVMLSTIIIYFAQISSDVFVGIRLLRLEAFMDVGFYAADCCCGMLYWFVSLNSLSKLDIAFEEFHYSLRSYFRTDYPGRLFHLKKYKSLPRMAAYIGPSAMTRLTVGTCMMTLLNYYILAAMW